jgi:hypothetical protein
MNRTSLRFALLGVVFARCAGSPTEIRLDQEFELAPRETGRIAGTSQTITFESVSQDSRCAANVTCVWAGNAEIRLKVRAADRDSSVALNTTVEPHAATVGAVRVELKALSPEPRAGSPIPSGTYRVRLVVTGS